MARQPLMLPATTYLPSCCFAPYAWERNLGSFGYHLTLTALTSHLSHHSLLTGFSHLTSLTSFSPLKLYGFWFFQKDPGGLDDDGNGDGNPGLTDRKEEAGVAGMKINRKGQGREAGEPHGREEEEEEKEEGRRGMAGLCVLRQWEEGQGHACVVAGLAPPSRHGMAVPARTCFGLPSPRRGEEEEKNRHLCVPGMALVVCMYLSFSIPNSSFMTTTVTHALHGMSQPSCLPLPYPPSLATQPSHVPPVSLHYLMFCILGRPFAFLLFILSAHMAGIFDHFCFVCCCLTVTG